MISIKSISGFSKQGKRENNEDYVLFKEKHDHDSRFIILCDGMGGHGHGEIASQTVADAVFGFLKNLGKEKYEAQDLQDALDAALSTLTAADIYNDKKSMGTTLVVVVINRMNILIGHVGDSRCYLFDENGLKKFRTKDHSKVAEAIDAEILTEEEAFDNPHKNLLTRCVMSGKDNVIIDVDDLTIEDNYRLLLCSDGVTDAMRDKEIEECMINRDIEGALEIIDSICSEKSNDNYSAILVDFSQDETNQTHQNNNNAVTDNNQTEETITCLSCGATNDKNAKFCRNCGAELRIKIKEKTTENSPKREEPKENKLAKLLKKFFPLIFFLLGVVLMASYYKISNNIEQKRLLSELTSLQAKDIYRMQQFDEFISDICTIDSTGINKDSVLRKDTILELYKKFRNEHFSTIR